MERDTASRGPGNWDSWKNPKVTIPGFNSIYWEETKQGEYIFFILFKKSNILFRCAFLSFIILNSLLCLLPGGYSRKFWIGVCREGSWILTLFKD